MPATLLLTAALASGCSSVGPGGFSTWQVEATAPPSSVSLQGIPVRTGQILVSEQGTPNSLFLALLVGEDRRYVHSAIVVVEDGSPMVYEANGHIQPALGNRPLTQRVVGGMRRMELATFLNRNSMVALYDPPPGADGERIGRFAQESLAAGLPFDALFDGSD
ncbi:MAG: hypothetical protein ABIX37_04225, partial [Gammaproteobacteria bacterium]